MFTDTDIEEQFAYFERLAKSADPMKRELAQAELDRLATVDLEKVGPKGYIHGWIFVGAPGVGGRVHHPQHGHGTITRHGKRTVGVRFDNGQEHAFEHSVRHDRVGEASGHFGQRLDGRSGKPVKVPEVTAAKKPEAKPKAPKAPKAREPGEARRGDIVLVHTRSAEGTRDGRGKTVHRLEVARVTSVTRDGKVKEYLRADAGDGARPYKVSNDHRSTQYHVIPQEKIDTEAALETARNNSWNLPGGGGGGKPYYSLDEAREAMKPHLREEQPSEPDHLTLAHAAIQEGRHADAVNHLTAAANAAPDKVSRDAILARRTELTSRLMGKPSKPKPPEPERPMRSAREEVKDASGMRMVGEAEHPRGPATDFVVQQHPAVKRAEQGVCRSAGGLDGTPTPAAVRALHDAYRAAGTELADKRMREEWNKLDDSQRHAALTDSIYGDRVLTHLAAIHHHVRVRNDPAASAEVKKSAAEAADKAYRNVHSIESINARRGRVDARRAATWDSINRGDASAAVGLLPPKADDRITRRVAETITPQVDASLTGRRLQAAAAVRNAEVDVTRARLTEDALRRRTTSRPSSREEHRGVQEALRAEGVRNGQEWSEASKAHEAAKERLSAAQKALESAEAEHTVAVGRQHTEVMRQMREEFDKLVPLPKSTEGKDIAKEAGVPRTITRLTGHEKELARDVNKRADILNEGLDKSGAFNRQADIVVAHHARLSGTLLPEVQDRLDALHDQARSGRGEGATGVYRKNLTGAIARWKEFQRAKNGVSPRDEDEMAHRETLAIQMRQKEPELAARIRAGNKPGGSTEPDDALPLPDLPKPKAPRSRGYREPTGLEPGAQVSWTHHHEDGTTTTRTGRVWSTAPKPGNAQDAAWVTPDTKLPSDRYSAVVVHQDRPTRAGRPVHFVSHDGERSHSGSLAVGAAHAAERHRATGKAFRPIDPLIEAAVEHALSKTALS